jgi:hypothetical protein
MEWNKFAKRATQLLNLGMVLASDPDSLIEI